MLNFSNLTYEEFYRINQFSGTKEIELIGNLLDEKNSFELKQEKYNSRIEVLEEQIYFAQELIDSIKEFSKTLPKTERAALKSILENTSFES